AIFDPRTGTGAVLTDIHPTPDGPRYATRKDFVYGEDVTIGDWTIATDGLPRYPPPGEVGPDRLPA
ncbi:Uma2 family endonuclease, partial [Streptomyces sp. NPDC002172]